MKVIVLHGPGEIAKRHFLISLKATFSSEGTTVLEGKQASSNQVKTTLSSGSLFSDKRLVILENATDDLDLSEFKNQDDGVTLIVVAQSPSATKVILKSAAQIKAQIHSFEGEKETSAFPFLDALIERKTGALVELVKLLEEYGEMYTLTMIYYLWRRNILPAPASAFAAKKIASQKVNYSSADFAQYYSWTLDAEAKIKTGALPGKLVIKQLVQQIISG